MVNEYGAVGGVRIGRGNRSIWRKTAPVPICPPQIRHNLTWDQSQAAMVGNRRVTAQAVAQPRNSLLFRSSVALNLVAQYSD
jgi:hypothetical protein